MEIINSSRGLVPRETHTFQVRAVEIGGCTCPGPCGVASAAPPRPIDNPPPCRRRHSLPAQGPPRTVGALRATLAEGAFESLGEMPETRRMSTTAEHSAGSGVWSLRTIFGDVSGGSFESRHRRMAAWSAPSPRETAMDFLQSDSFHPSRGGPEPLV